MTMNLYFAMWIGIPIIGAIWLGALDKKHKALTRRIERRLNEVPEPEMTLEQARGELEGAGKLMRRGWKLFYIWGGIIVIFVTAPEVSHWFDQ